MTTDQLLALEVEDYSSRPANDTQSTTRGSTTVSIRGLLVLTVFFVAFVSVAVYLGRLAGAC
ncbi:hypothetical protein [Actinomycetospora sp.]|jgi:hypothetical protein|uniref:hypothetical protein n=1 Tax=Actinomycetospora sp. TaxID=1872135 RepID=UPI002F4248E3